MRRARGQLKGPIAFAGLVGRGVQPSGRRRSRGARLRPGAGHGCQPRPAPALQPHRRAPPGRSPKPPAPRRRSASASSPSAARARQRSAWSWRWPIWRPPTRGGPDPRPRPPCRRPPRRWRGCRCCRRTGAGGCSRSMAAPVSGSVRGPAPAPGNPATFWAVFPAADGPVSLLLPGFAPLSGLAVASLPAVEPLIWRLVVSSATWRSSKPRTCGRPT